MPNADKKDIHEEIAIKEIRRALKGLQYGCVSIIVQDSVVIQIDRTSKGRLDYSSLEKVFGGEGI